MNSMHRQIGRIRNKGPGDAAKVSVLLNDYEDANKMLTNIIEASKAWRDAWVSILSSQLNTTQSFRELYEPIVGTSDAHRDNPAITPRKQMERTIKLQETFEELKTDLLEEVMMMDSRVTKPAIEAKDFLQPIRKTIKKRENKRLDWERYIDKVNKASTKMRRTDKENAALAKAEQDQARAGVEFKDADDHLRETLPPVISAAFSILPHLLAVQIMIQNTLLAQYYTALHNYCEDTGFPSPPPPMEDVISTWNSDYQPIKEEVESIDCIRRGRAIHQPMNLGEENTASKSITGLNVRNGFSRRPSNQSMSTNRAPSPNPSVSPGPENRAPPPISSASRPRIPSTTTIPVFSPPAPAPAPSSTSSPTPSSLPTPDYSTHLTPVSSISSYSPAGPSMDYFQRSSTNDSLVAGKKKPPPPPPKRLGSSQGGVYVVALYAFEGQGDGDLSFKEGDRIRVTKKTGSTDDWWDGELRGMKGSFPANYCKNA
ncbi:SH3 domain signaling protein [Rutstroemia sp. NJR-2017a WRK4]|nr:SH3 domain signaling protein [Rutstroemia sp. NJR-2017a WRK4]